MKTKERLVGVVVTLCSSAIMYLVFTLINSFETKASSDTKFMTLSKKMDLMLCYMEKKYCFKEKR